MATLEGKQYNLASVEMSRYYPTQTFKQLDVDQIGIPQNLRGTSNAITIYGQSEDYIQTMPDKFSNKGFIA